MPHISIIIPFYGCRICLMELYLRIKQTLEQMEQTFELIIVNDASPDNAWDDISNLCQKDKRVRGLNFSRNFGQHYAIAAGLQNAKGEWVVVMDCDLQDQPEEIPNLYNKALEGFDIVHGSRSVRQDKFFKRKFSSLFYRTLGYLTDTKQDSTIANFGIYHRKVIKAICSMGDYQRYFPTMVRWVGFRSTVLPIKHSERLHGKTTYSFKKLFRLALEVILAFSDKPLRLTVKFGLIISFLALLFGLYNIYRFFTNQIVVLGWTSTITSVWLLSGIIIFTFGMVGLYIGKIFDKVKQRPLYIVSETANMEQNND